MHTDYNQIAAEYKKAKQQPWRLHVEHYTLFELIGDLAGQSILDLACGEGFHTRFLKQRGSGRTVGVDVSERMIELARNEESARPLGVEYLVHDVKTLVMAEPFDMVTAGYLLNYASTEEELGAMCQAIGRCLKPGRRFVTVNSNPAHAVECFPRVEKYGFLKILDAEELAPGAPIIWRFFLDNGSIDITNYYLSPVAHESAFRAAGFRTVKWHMPRVSPEGEAAFGSDFWAEMVERPPIIFMECIK